METERKMACKKFRIKTSKGDFTGILMAGEIAKTNPCPKCGLEICQKCFRPKVVSYGDYVEASECKMKHSSGCECKSEKI